MRTSGLFAASFGSWKEGADRLPPAPATLGAVGPRRTFLVALSLVLLGAIAVLLDRRGADAEPMAPAPADAPSDPGTSPEHAAAPVDDTAAADAAPVAATPPGGRAPATARDDRPGELVVTLHDRAMLEFDTFLLGAEGPDERFVTMERAASAYSGTFRATVAPGTWRIVVLRGPGDRPGVERSERWTMDLPDEVLVLPGERSRAALRLDRTLDPPPLGTATLVGTAFVDGRPAVGASVCLAPTTAPVFTKVATDGTWRLVDAPAGRHMLRLLQPVPGRRPDGTAAVMTRLGGAGMAAARDMRDRPPGNDALQALAERLVQPAAGATLNVALDARTVAIGGVVQDRLGRGVPARVTVEAAKTTMVIGIPHRPSHSVETDTSGAFLVENLAPGGWEL